MTWKTNPGKPLQTQIPFHILHRRNTDREILQSAATINPGDRRSRRHTILPRAGLPDPADSFSVKTKNKIYPLNTSAAITDKFIHAELKETMYGKTNFSNPSYQILARGGGERKTNKNHLTQQKSCKQHLNNVTDMEKIEMQKN